MITDHQFIHQYPINKESTGLILGTIHPHFTDQFKVDFFYGNECSLWKILHQAFPEELTDPYSVSNIRQFLSSRYLSISDTILQCERTTSAALDKDLIPRILNTQLKEYIKNSQITTILCTSGFGKNNAFRLFYCDILRQPLNKRIKEAREVTVLIEGWNRPITIKALYSPSGTANTGLVNSKAYKEKAHLYVDHPTPVSAFKVDYYKQMFQ